VAAEYAIGQVLNREMGIFRVFDKRFQHGHLVPYPPWAEAAGLKNDAP
jgi:hypothetical protein